MLRIFTSSSLAIAAALSLAPAAMALQPQTRDTARAAEQPAKNAASERALAKPTRQAALAMLESWKETPQKTGKEMISTYGAPDEMTPTRMVWLNKGPWKWSILTNNPTQHNFPVPHEDVLEQAISYNIDVEKLSDLGRYDGSVVANRTQGELSARCDKEGANFLAINLANDISTGSKTVEAARTYYAKAMDSFMKENKMDPYMTDLKFEVPKPAQARDADRQASL